MVLLAIDTSGRNGSLALVRVVSGQTGCDVLEVMPLEGGTFSAQLIPQVAALLAKHKLSRADISAFATVSGPGSFTGLRVGLAAIKALADVLQKPIAPVSMLAAVARSSSVEGAVLAVIDAGRNQLYVGEYDSRTIAPSNEWLLNREEFVARSKEYVVVTPDEPIASFAKEAGFRTEVVAPPRSDTIARLGWEQVLRGATVSSAELEANYIRRSDAEIFSNPQV